ncbi:MAG TPA: anthranilate phosphoribosyltransferase [Candidatus Hydrogenedentes bacterium]|nr:anthranilate phosphoribosyltransferase [Candidatus Hydrogenedentota bacterium]HOK88704.1 anthranilate phosphoribosyltransferase [Candidatus Hydrogenedentota bacterium]
MTAKSLLLKITRHEDLSLPEATEFMELLISGELPQAMAGALLTALRMKRETSVELAAMARVLLTRAPAVPCGRRPLLDTCGTGGDGLGTFNISTAVAFVAAGAGVAVAKHGNRSASSRCGSADVLEALGVNIDLPPEAVGQCVDAVGIGFLFARSLHRAVGNVAQVRKDLGLPTVFNLLGPLVNPARPDRQCMGVSDASRLEEIARVLSDLGVARAFVVTGADGMDEVALHGPTEAVELRDGALTRHCWYPEDFGVTPAGRDTLRGGDATENADILRGVLSGERGPRRDVVLANAALALVVTGLAASPREGARLAAEVIDSGAALAKLDALIRFTREYPGEKE